MYEIFKAILPTVVGAIFGSYIVYTYQMKNWKIQQKVADRDAIFSELKKLYDDVDRLVNARLFHSRRLAWVILSNDRTLLVERLKAYDSIVVEWNEKLNSFFVRFVRILPDGVDLHRRFEREIVSVLVDAGASFERAVRSCRSDAMNSNLLLGVKLNDKRLEALNNTVNDVIREIYIRLQRYKDDRFIVIGDEMDGSVVDDDAIKNVSYVALLKAIFKARE